MESAAGRLPFACAYNINIRSLGGFRPAHFPKIGRLTACVLGQTSVGIFASAVVGRDMSFGSRDDCGRAPFGTDLKTYLTHSSSLMAVDNWFSTRILVTGTTTGVVLDVSSVMDVRAAIPHYQEKQEEQEKRRNYFRYANACACGVHLARREGSVVLSSLAEVDWNRSSFFLTKELVMWFYRFSSSYLADWFLLEISSGKRG